MKDDLYQEDNSRLLDEDNNYCVYGGGVNNFKWIDELFMKYKQENPEEFGRYVNEFANKINSIEVDKDMI